jgi:hypothetical protein
MAAALGLTVVAAMWPVDDQTDANLVAKPTARQRGVAVAMAQSAVPPSAVPATSAHAPPNNLPDRSQWSALRVYRDPFEGQTGLGELPAPKPAAKAVAAAASAPPPPPAPTVPWPYAGRLLVPGQADAVLLHDGTRTVPLAVGATLGDWRLDADRGQQLEFTHLPTGAAVVLPLTQ